MVEHARFIRIADVVFDALSVLTAAPYGDGNVLVLFENGTTLELPSVNLAFVFAELRKATGEQL